MLDKSQIVSFHVLERESKQNLITWTYPTIAEDLRKILASTDFVCSSKIKDAFFYIRNNNLWIYINQFTKNSKVSAIVVVSGELNPSKYRIICDNFTKIYLKTSNPVEILKSYLKLFISGNIELQENGTEISVNLKTFSPTNDKKLKDLIKSLGLEIILIFNAILLKKRILVYHSNVEELQEGMLAMCNLVLARNYNIYHYPLINNFNSLKGLEFYLAGTMEERLLNDEKQYDIKVNLCSKEIEISSKSKQYFAMTKFHKDIAQFMVELAHSDTKEAKVIDEIGIKTQDLLRQITSLATHTLDNKRMVTMQSLKSQNFSPALENFLFYLGVAENIMLF